MNKEINLSPDHDQLSFYVGELFEMIQDKFYASNKVINQRSLTRYDMLMESIARLLYESEDFRYENDIQVCSYIMDRIKSFMNTEKIRVQRTSLPVRIDVIGETAFALLGHYTLPNLNDIGDVMKVLRSQSDPTTITMIILRGKGFTETEIGQQFGCHQSTVNKRINGALQAIKTA